jgi:hypothetical protein
MRLFWQNRLFKFDEHTLKAERKSLGVNQFIKINLNAVMFRLTNTTEEGIIIITISSNLTIIQ